MDESRILREELVSCVMMREFNPHRKASKKEKKNTEMIRAFIDIQELRDNYEVWAPYFRRGVIGFADLVVENRSSISLFKFRHDAENLEKHVKSLKLENKFLPETRNARSKTVHPYLVLEDKEKNRKSILSQLKLLENQPFEILLLDRERSRVESPFELREIIPRLFRARGMRLEEKALDDLIEKQNCAEIERAILNLDDSPDTVTSELVEQVAGYMKRNDEPPEDLEAIEGSPEGEGAKPYMEDPAEQSCRKMIK
ncbi:hypothetical protein AKJ41_05580 [candidate division MSBL1 archaeon SCGC-AAA259O05]|uniref:Uncharacterized protein n=1 Tax=candidate division MSBL1 archaeon SCGC-AAA259O05 TaxID=1698271 RepID=A0A133UYU4_9EURY|nr:hypothetical protein AKJ41_05580 [candidate division MSBL1 archaeon SCGC-AAA259O05]